MAQDFNKRRPKVPYNPGVRELVTGKQRWSRPAAAEGVASKFQGWHERGYLPHRDELGLIQFVTFHLADSFPESRRSEWAHLAKIECERERRKQWEACLDRGGGECHLRIPEIATLIEDNFRGHGGESYQLRAWVIMPNHVHVLIKVGNVPLGTIIGSWKKHTAWPANKALGKTGAFWAKDYFDVFMRDSVHERRTSHYIENNPVRAKLVEDSKKWPWSSARFRDELGNLNLEV